MATLAPKAARPRAMPRPIPAPPPVTTATRSVRSAAEGFMDTGTSILIGSAMGALSPTKNDRSHRSRGGVYATDRADPDGPAGRGAQTDHRGGCGRRHLRHPGPPADLRLPDRPDHADQHGPQRLGQAEPPRRPDPRADPDPERPAGRVPAVHAVAQARLHHRRGRGLPDRPGPLRPDRPGASGRGVPGPAVGRPSRHRRRDLPPAGRGLHRGADRRAGLHLCQHHGHPPFHPHPGRVRHRLPR